MLIELGIHKNSWISKLYLLENIKRASQLFQNFVAIYCCCILLCVFADVYGEKKKHNIFKNTRKKNHFINSNSVLSQSPENCWFIPLLPKDLIIGPTASLQPQLLCLNFFFLFFNSLTHPVQQATVDLEKSFVANPTELLSAENCPLWRLAPGVFVLAASVKEERGMP